MKRIFISSVQREFERERAAIKRMIEADPIVRAYYDAFVFEIDAPAAEEAINEVIFEAIKNNPGINKPRLIAMIGKSRATIERGVAILVDAARIEHRGSKKTGGYYPLSAKGAGR